MKNKLENIKLIIVYALLFIMFILLIVGVMFAIKNYNSEDIVKIEGFDPTVTISKDQIDRIAQPTPGLSIVIDTLPKTKDTITTLSVKQIKTLFQTSKKSMLLLVKDDCSYCTKFEPTFKQALEELSYTAYKVNISKISDKELKELIDYIDYDGTPTTYVISNGKAVHTLTGDADLETTKAFIDYFYTRDN